MKDMKTNISLIILAFIWFSWSPAICHADDKKPSAFRYSRPELEKLRSTGYSQTQIIELEAMRSEFRAAPIYASGSLAWRLFKHISKGDSFNWVKYILGPPHSRIMHLDHRTRYTWNGVPGSWSIFIIIKDDKVDEISYIIE